jgi:hypothetical protein
VALSAEKLLNFNSPGALEMGAEDAAEAALCRVMDPCILNQMLEHRQGFKSPAIASAISGYSYFRRI